MSGSYPVPWKVLVFAAVTLVYVASPVDFLPEYIPFFGVVDDVVLLGVLLRSVRSALKTFEEWETSGAVTRK